MRDEGLLEDILIPRMGIHPIWNYVSTIKSASDDTNIKLLHNICQFGKKHQTLQVNKQHYPMAYVFIATKGNFYFMLAQTSTNARRERT